MRPGRTLTTEGGWSAHLSHREEEAARAKEAERVREKRKEKARPDGPEPAPASGRSGKVRNPYRFARLEESIMEHEERIAAINAEMLTEAAYRDADRFRALKRELDEREAELARLNEEWENWE